MWNDEIILVSEKVVGEDRLKQAIVEEDKLTILCKKRSVTRTEFYQANQAGLRPSLVVDIRSFEYDNQKIAIFDCCRYRILKTYHVNNEILELTLMEEL